MNCSIMIDIKTMNSRGFGFVIFEHESSVDDVMHNKKIHQIKGKWIDCKRANPFISKKNQLIENNEQVAVGDRNLFNLKQNMIPMNYTNQSKNCDKHLLKNKNFQIQNSDTIPTFIPKSMRNKIISGNEMNEEEFAFKNSYNPNSKFSNDFQHQRNNYNPNISGITCGNKYFNNRDSFQKYSSPMNQSSKSNNSNTSQNINNFNYYNTNINNYYGFGSCCNNYNHNNYSSDFLNNNNCNYNTYINSFVNIPENSYQQKFSRGPNLCANCHSSFTGDQGQAYSSNNISFRNYDYCDSKNSNTPYNYNFLNYEKNSINYVINDAIKSNKNKKYTEDISSLSTKSQSENYFAYKFSNYEDESLRLNFNKHIEYIQQGPIKLFDTNDEERRKYENCNEDDDNYEMTKKQEMSKIFYGPQKSKNICNTYFRFRLFKRN